MSTRFGANGPGGPAHLGDALSGLLDGELPGHQEDWARAHLAVCTDCTRELAAVGQARAWVRALPPVDPPFGFYERMLRDPSLASRPPAIGSAPFGASRATLRRRAGWAALGAAAAAVTVLGVGSPTEPPLNPAVPRLVQARAARTTVGADLMSKLAPVAVPVSFGR